MAKAYQTAAVLFEVLKAVNRDKTEEPPPEVSRNWRVMRKTKVCCDIDNKCGDKAGKSLDLQLDLFSRLYVVQVWGYLCSSQVLAAS